MYAYKGIKIRGCEDVYEPSDDTFLLLESLEHINLAGKRAIEIGTGTGIISIYLAKKGAIVDAVDINPQAVSCAKRNAKENSVIIEVYESSFFERVGDKKFDLIIFNPPYLPEDEEDRKCVDVLTLAWMGGKGGIEKTERFLYDAKEYLRENGEIYVVLSSLSEIDSLLSKFSSIYVYEVLSSAKFDFETIYVYKFKKR